MTTPVIIAGNLSKTYKVGLRNRPVQALNDVSFEVHSGETFAFLGLNGAGKTTTIKMLLDSARPTSGNAYLFGINAINPSARARVGYLPDLPHFYRFLSARELLDYFGRLFGLTTNRRREQTERLLKIVGLSDRGNEPVGGFSRGMLQRVGLAQALINDPDLLILDEPLGGLDPVGRYELRRIIFDLKATGKTIFFSSHILEDAERVADRVAIISRGHIYAIGTLEELLTQKSGWNAEIEPLTSESDGLISSFGCNYEKRGKNLWLTIQDDSILLKIHQLASTGQLRLLSLQPARRSLEEVFIEGVK